ncbi:hypothetical protein [Arthrobacter sp. ISL-30]|uniref:hypothetical protein n=1 Tax=Arthrobacter sp. ISL-30 TaxID=2819109 RepID=UPI001BEA893C|nr:hypothetical protein [Arthrobacter sp. ISL-30]
MGSKDDNLETSIPERVKALAAAKTAAERLKAEGKSMSAYGQEHSVAMEKVQDIIEQWPEAPKMTAAGVLEKYGPPNEATVTKLLWYRTGPWSRMELTSDEVVHNFPTPHVDYFTQYVSYRIPARSGSDIVEFDGSVLLDRTAGEIGSRCDHEAYNTLTLNLAVEIIEGRRTVQDARDLYAKTAAAFVMGRDAPYAESLLFTPGTDTADPDEATIATDMLEQKMEKVKDVFGAGETPR